MTQEAKPDQTTDRQREFQALVAKRITEWWAQHDDPATAFDAVHRKMDAMQTIETNCKIGQYTAIAEALRVLDAEIIVAAIRVVAEAEGNAPWLAEAEAMARGIAKGMQLGAYLDSDSAASWLERHTTGDRQTETE